MIRKSILILIQVLLLTSGVMAQGVEMADTMRSNGKIYVVVAVLCLIFVGIVAYLISIDKKVGKLEKKINS
ncbi:MAG: CcmD family protein [Crocinitomicaceae bacterium]|nr:CcmD family protein [Crocinitomicaceae bacterium]|tara:strand:- start:2768 stop:2980 length:213 start_codon:yes stop_codon:yes gene_type:complete